MDVPWKRSLTNLNDVFDSDSDPDSSPLPSKQRPRGPVIPKVCLLQPPHKAEELIECYTDKRDKI